MRISDFDYDLPENLIAQTPLPVRDASRMLVVNRLKRKWLDQFFASFTEYLAPDDVVVINNTRVIPARLVGKRRRSGGRVEIFLLRKLKEKYWEALIRPGRRLKQGSIVDFDESLSAVITDDPGEELRHVRFTCAGSFVETLARIGFTPLPPYIKRAEASAQDRDRYQTVYASNSGAIAAPTAGLHFTPQILQEVRNKAAVAEITLHVGYGTFEPVRVDKIEEHHVGGESYAISKEAAEMINRGRSRGGRIIAVGTTTVRTLESASNSNGELMAHEGESNLTIVPGYQFRIVNALLTNFHLPRSSLLLLVSAFAGQELTLAAYRHAVDQRYRFYSYGDCMLIV